MRLPFRKSKNGITIEVKVEPRSSKKGIAGVMENVVKVKLTAPPVGGEANEQLIEVMSEATGVRKSDIRIVCGHSSKKKVVEIRGVSDI
jgi:uncharacterized protein (TIGR00251 family)